ncbi:DivIVA domain-containing protein [Nocardiopsis sp. CC223A]|uniref:DivIVA domain-containing protein n=1 Tax=Nocardiopsis sp. CC223A TaxID=3044051 RepID=UPI00278BF39C|nr:DivIVA domain-containing protein [Nocardiopsis sp. CC223A]
MHSPSAIPEFDVILRGYDRVQVTDLVHRVSAALAAGAGAAPPAGVPGGTLPITSAELSSARLDVVLRGFDRVQVTDWIDGAAGELARLESRNGGVPAPSAPGPAAAEAPPPQPAFDVVLRGYERTQVSDLLDRAYATLTARTGVAAPVAVPPGTATVTADELASARFDVVLRGYDRAQVADALNDLARRIARAEARSGPE